MEGNVTDRDSGSGVVLNFLSDDDIATLGAPGGDDVDPTMTAIFKVRRRPLQQSTHILHAGSMLWSYGYAPKCSSECIHSHLCCFVGEHCLLAKGAYEHVPSFVTRRQIG